MNIRPIDSYEVYRELLKGRRPDNNGFWPDEIKRYIADKRLAYAESDNILFLLYDEKEYRQLVAAGVTTEAAKTGTIESSKSAEPAEILAVRAADIFKELKSINDTPVICQIVENREKRNQEALRELIEKLDFKCRCAINEYVLEDVESIEPERNLTDVRIRRSAECNEEYCKILKLWKDNLPVIEIPYISVDDLKKMSSDGNLFILDNVKTGQIAAACCFDAYLGASTIHHIVVEPAYRKCGYATILIKEWIAQLRKMGVKKARSWVEESNTASIKSFEKAGFHMTANVSYQYIYN